MPLNNKSTGQHSVEIKNLKARSRCLEDSLHECQAHIKVLIDSAPVGIYTTTSTGKVLSFNPQMVHILGFSSADEALSHYENLGSQLFVDAQKRDEILVALKINGFVENFEYEAMRADGRIIWLSVCARLVKRNADGSFVLTGFATDITERKKNILEREKLLSAIEQTVDAILITDIDGIVTYVNSAFENITGYTCKEVIGQSIGILRSDEHDASFYQGLWETVSCEKVWQGRIKNKKKDGSLYTVESSISPVLNGAGIIDSYVWTNHDVSREVELEQQYCQTQKLESVGQLAGGVAHDFNNMLAIILGRAELGMKKLDQTDPTFGVLEEIRNAAQSAAKTARQLLTFSRQQAISPVVLDLNQAITDILRMLRRLIGENINLHWLPKAPLPSIKIDPSQIDQILANLLINARDAITDIGTITIETEQVTIDQDYCSRHADFIPGSYNVLIVSDDGCGMDLQTLTHIFDPFFTTKDLGRGTGLGMATVYGIVRQNNGFINVYSEPGLGSTFRIYLPQCDEVITETCQTAGSESNKIESKVILVVEDEAAILSMVQAMLQDLGHTVLTAGSAREAATKMADYPDHIDLLLTDVVMPEMNGRDLAKKLKNENSNLFVLFMSGYTSSVIAQRGVLDEGVNYLQKPFSKEDLKKRLETIFSVKK